MSLCIFVILISYVYSSMSLEYHSCCTIPMDTPLPPLRPQTPRDDSKSSTSRLANSSNVRCSCEMCSRLASELHELRAEFRAKLDGIQQIVTIMNSKLDVYLYPLSRIEETTQEDQNTDWSVSYELDTTQAAED
ncbi:hypothetical protein F4824DRAFT_298298 [Ustulina deusta]|nr:hypothetical protein F4824DRAFT_298298 [Ustulina deusta]